jgi:hypothetical protein
MKFSAGEVGKINDHIIEFYFEKDIEIDEKLSVEILSAIHALAGGKPHALLYNFNNRNVIISEIARKLSGARSYTNALLIARALVTQSFTSSLESSYYIKNDNPAAETRMFNTKEKAVDWLNEKIREFTTSS